MDSQGIYNEMIKIKKQKANVINNREKYEKFSEKLEKLIKELNEIANNFNNLLLKPPGLVIDSQPAGNNKIAEIKKSIESTILKLKNQVRIEIDDKIKKLNSDISSLDRKYKILSNQYQDLSE